MNFKWSYRTKTYKDGRDESHLKYGRRIVKRWPGNCDEDEGLLSLVKSAFEDMKDTKPTLRLKTKTENHEQVKLI
jgi:hypothetical protein